MPTFKKNNTSPPMLYILEAPPGTPIDLRGLTVTFYMRIEDPSADTPYKVSAGVCTLVDAENGEVRYDWQSGDLDTVGDYNAEFRVQTASGPRTVPASGYIPVKVTEPA